MRVPNEDWVEPCLEDLEDYSSASIHKINPETGIIYANQLCVNQLNQLEPDGELYKKRDGKFYKTIGIGERKFAYLDDKVREKFNVSYLETGNLQSCIGVGIRTNNNELALAHLDGHKREQLDFFFDQIDYKLDGEKEEAVIISLLKTEEFDNCAEKIETQTEGSNITKILGLYNLTAGYPLTLGLDQEDFYFPVIGKSKNGFPMDTSEIEINELKDSTQYLLENEDRTKRYFRPLE